jgi:hypothetical protein
MINLLRNKSERELDEIFCSSGEARLPAPGNYQGAWLTWIENPGTRKPFNQISQTLMFKLTPFGITFNADSTGIWYFFNPLLAAGNFMMRAEPSYWRETEAVSLNYEMSKLPGLVKGMLYDEIKVIDNNHILGLGGFKAPRDEGDNFYFLLSRV